MLNKKFKTNIKCGACVATVAPYLNAIIEIKDWDVDTLNPDKILTVSAEGINTDKLLNVLAKAGYHAKEIKCQNI